MKNKNMHVKIGKLKVFTVLEIMVVLLVIGILIGLVAMRSYVALEKSKYEVFCTNLSTIERVLLTYYTVTGNLPANADEVNSIINSNTFSIRKSTNPYTGTVFIFKDEQPSQKGDVQYKLLNDEMIIESVPACK